MASDDPKDKPGPSAGEIVLKSAGGLVAVGAGSAVGGFPGALVGGWLSTVLPDLVSRLLAALRAREERRATEYLSHLLGDDATSEDEARARIEAMTSSEDGAQAIVRHVRELAAMTDPALIPALAALAREYMLAGKSPDRFFRNATRFFTGIVRIEALGLGRVLAKGKWPGVPETFAIVLRAGREGEWPCTVANVTEEWAGDSAKLFARVPVPFGFEFLAELRGCDLAFGGHTGTDCASGPDIALVRRDVALRLAALLRWVK